MASPHKELSALRQNRQILIILIFSLVTIVIWVAVGLITSQKKTAISSELQLLSTPLNPSINLEILESIEDKKSYSSSQLNDFPIYLLQADGDRLREIQQRVSPPVQLQEEEPEIPPAQSDLNSLLPSEASPSADVPPEEGEL